MKRHCKKRAGREILAAPRVQRKYVTYFNAVDKNGRDSAEHSTTIKTNRYYIRIMTWILDRVIHTMYVVVVTLSAGGIGKPGWKRYSDKHGGRQDSRLILRWLLSIIPSRKSGMENLRDQIGCATVLVSLVIATSVIFV